MQRKKKKKLSPNYSFNEIIEIIPLLLSLAVVPMIVFLKISPVEEGRFYWRSNVDYDFFSFYKSVSLIALSIFSLILLLIKTIQGKVQIKLHKYDYCLFTFMILVILSALFSSYQKTSWLGFYNRYEGALAILSYVILLLYGMHNINTKKQVKILLFALIISCVLIMSIGIFQFFGVDFFRTDFGKQLIMPHTDKSQALQLIFQAEKSMVYGTFKHPNYYGSYMAIIIPFIGTLFFFSKRKKHRLLLGVLFAMAVITLMGSRSRGGLLGVVVAFLVFIILLRKKLFKQWKLLSVMVLVGFSGLFITDLFTGGSIIGKIKSITSDPRVKINHLNLDKVEIQGNSLKIFSTTEYLEIENMGNYRFAFKDKNGKYLISSIDKNSEIVFKEEQYKEFSFLLGNHEKGLGLQFTYGDLSAIFLITKTSFKLINPKNQAVDLKKIPSWGFKGKELWGSSRGYIWSRTIPLVKNTIFVGHGPDTFAIYFPQHDYIGKLKNYGTMNIIVDKAHNMYLQLAINTGFLSSIILVIFLIFYLMTSINLYLKNPLDSLFSVMGAAILFSVIGYLTTGFFNDSVVSVSAVFWVLLGVGMSINRIIKEDQK